MQYSFESNNTFYPRHPLLNSCIRNSINWNALETSHCYTNTAMSKVLHFINMLSWCNCNVATDQERKRRGKENTILYCWWRPPQQRIDNLEGCHRLGSGTKRGFRHAAHAAQALRWRTEQFLKYLIKQRTLS